MKKFDIEAYLDGSLSQEALEAFNQEMHQNPAFAQQVETQRKVSQLLRTHLLREQVRSHDLVAQELGDDTHGLHARLGGDEFCFLLSDLAEHHPIHAICERFHRAVRDYDWTSVDPRLSTEAIRVDIGVACLRLGRLAERRFISQRLATGLIEKADALMYRAKADRERPVYVTCLQIGEGELVEIACDDKRPPAQDVLGNT